MATYTLTLNAAQQEVLQWLVNTLNAEKGTNLTIEEYLNLQVPILLQPYQLRFEAYLDGEVAKRFAAADAATKAAVKARLGLG